MGGAAADGLSLTPVLEAANGGGQGAAPVEAAAEAEGAGSGRRRDGRGGKDGSTDEGSPRQRLSGSLVGFFRPPGSTTSAGSSFEGGRSNSDSSDRSGHSSGSVGSLARTSRKSVKLSREFVKAQERNAKVA